MSDASPNGAPEPGPLLDLTDTDRGLLAVDLGLRAGLAWFDGAGRLVRYRATAFPDRSRLRRAVPKVCAEGGPLSVVVAEGDAGLAKPWAAWARRKGVVFERFGAARWRRDLLTDAERRSGGRAKRTAGALSLDILAASGAARPTSPLRHDVAEAICIGFWAAWVRGWTDDRLVRDAVGRRLRRTR